MKTVKGLNRFRKQSFKNPKVVAIGTFDGVHLAHLAVIKKAVQKAKKVKGTSIVLTFYPHPMRITDPDQKPALLTSIEHRLALIERLAPDVCLVANFRKSFSKMSAEKFVEQVLIDRLGSKIIVTGHNFSFGKNKSGNLDFLKMKSKEYDYKVDPVKPIKKAGAVVSSTLIRKLIESGKIEKASILLGRRFSILGTVIKGDSRGRVLGYPTANIDPHQEALPPNGVYAIKAKINDKYYKGMLNIGKRPTFYAKSNKLAIEANIFDFNKYIYGQVIEIFFYKKIRNEQKFNSPDLLKTQLENDHKQSLSILSKY
jgi:riboflavin kinase/FMN adenylyltransferase